MTDSGGDTFTVVVNDEEQHSVWRTSQPVPAGWREIGFTGSRQACLDHIAEVWTDITPKSVRERLAAERAKYSDSSITMQTAEWSDKG